jgi:hypothetical protein
VTELSSSEADLIPLVQSISTLPDISLLQQQVYELQSQVSSQGAGLTVSPQQAEFVQRASAKESQKQSEISLLIKLLSSESTRDYYQHLRLLLLCAHTGASAILCGNIETSGSSLAAVAKVGVENVPGMILKALGAAAENIPFLGAGATALTALIETSVVALTMQKLTPVSVARICNSKAKRDRTHRKLHLLCIARIPPIYICCISAFIAL